jgi:hypothetical protein
MKVKGNQFFVSLTSEKGYEISINHEGLFQ